MSHGGNWLWVALLLLLRYPLARGQTSVTEFLPEIDAHFTLNSNVRFLFRAKQTREGGDPTQAEIGPSVELLEAFAPAARCHSLRLTTSGVLLGATFNLKWIPDVFYLATGTTNPYCDGNSFIASVSATA